MYESRKFFQGLYSLSAYKVDELIREIEVDQRRRYPEASVIRDVRMVRCRTDVFKDYFVNRKRLKDENVRRFVPPFEEED